jgi:uncharacterized membrane protein YphA (DoxX/SURF4 family)
VATETQIPQLAAEPAAPPEIASSISGPAEQWNAATRLAFRFCFCYFGLYIFINMLGFFVPFFPFNFGSGRPSVAIVTWTAHHVFHYTKDLIYSGSGSGDKTFDYIQGFLILVFAILGTIVWSAFDRRRPNYTSLHKWFRVVVRFALGGTIIVYGFDKVWPLQMPFPALTRLVEPYGNFSPMGVLWYSVGASTAYEIFVGSMEVLGGVLVFIPLTATLGALVCFLDTAYIFSLNMMYDVPVKLFAGHLMLMSLFLLAPEMPRLVNIMVLNRGAGPSKQPSLFRSRRANWIAFAVQVVFGLFLVGAQVWNAHEAWYQYGGGAPKSALYGIWDIDVMSRDGQVVPPLLTDASRWRRAIFQVPQIMNFQKMDSTFQPYTTAIDASKDTIGFGKAADKNWKSNFTYQRPSGDHLILDGEMDGHKLHFEMMLVDRSKMLLVSRGFHWIQELPFNR